MNDPWATPEVQALRESVRRFTADRIVPHLSQWEDDGQLPRSLHREASDAGLLAVGFDEAVGGAGGTMLEASVVSESVLAAGGSTGVLASLFTHGIALPHLVASGSSDLVERFVRPTLAGELIGALGVTEPGGGSDVASLRTRARRDGDHYVVTGAKTFITSGVRADFVTTAVRTGGPAHGGGAGTAPFEDRGAADAHRGISLLVVPTDAPGFTVGRSLRKMGWHCSDTAELFLDDVRVPASNLVGEEGTGFSQVMQQFVGERLALAVQAYATAQRALDLAVQHARDRQTFGRPLVRRQVVRHTLVEMHSRTASARALVRGAVERSLATPASDPSMILDAVVAKNQAVACVEWVVDQAVQIHGGLGYLRETEIERHYRDTRILGIGGGATEVLKDLAARLLGY